MKLTCAPIDAAVSKGGGVRVVLYGRSPTASAGGSVQEEMIRRHLVPAPRAWDFLSLALSVVTADLACPRHQSPDGWTREFELEVAVAEPDHWNTQASALEGALAFLTTD